MEAAPAFHMLCCSNMLAHAMHTHPGATYTHANTLHMCVCVCVSADFCNLMCPLVAGAPADIVDIGFICHVDRGWGCKLIA